MPRQSIKRKIKVWLHCLFRFHRRGIVPHANHDMTQRWNVWLCVSCAEKNAPKISQPTQADIEWASRVINKLSKEIDWGR